VNLIDSEIILILQTAWIRGTVKTSEWLIVSGVGNKTSNGTVSSGVVKNFFENWSNLLKVVVPT